MELLGGGVAGLVGHHHVLVRAVVVGLVAVRVVGVVRRVVAVGAVPIIIEGELLVVDAEDLQLHGGSGDGVEELVEDVGPHREIMTHVLEVLCKDRYPQDAGPYADLCGVGGGDVIGVACLDLYVVEALAGGRVAAVIDARGCRHQGQVVLIGTGDDGVDVRQARHLRPAAPRGGVGYVGGDGHQRPGGDVLAVCGRRYVDPEDLLVGDVQRHVVDLDGGRVRAAGIELDDGVVHVRPRIEGVRDLRGGVEVRLACRWRGDVVDGVGP